MEFSPIYFILSIFFFKLNQSVASSRKPSLITVWYTPKVKESESEVSVVSDSFRPHGL